MDDPQRRRPDISRAKDLLDWEPAVPLAEGLQQTVDWFAGSLPTGAGGPSPAVFAENTATAHTSMRV